jgi:hypothetical protein
MIYFQKKNHLERVSQAFEKKRTKNKN